MSGCLLATPCAEPGGSGVYWIDPDGRLEAERIEEVAGLSLRLQSENDEFSSLRPRSVSILPIAQGCQAACPFFFSHASISADQAQATLDLGRIEEVLDESVARGAERAVLTGGGEPTLVARDKLLRMVEACGRRSSKVVLITNGYAWSRLGDRQRLETMARYRDAGLDVAPEMIRLAREKAPHLSWHFQDGREK